MFVYYHFSILYLAHISAFPFAHRSHGRQNASGLEGREKGGGGGWGRRRRFVMEGGRAGGGGVRQYHSSNIFHPLRPSSEPLLVGDRSDLISHMTLAGRRSGGATREADYLRPRLLIRRLLTRGEPRLSRPFISPTTASAGAWTTSPGCTFSTICPSPSIVSPAPGITRWTD